MQAKDYFDFETFDTPFGKVERIRLKGHRIDIEHVLEYLNQGMTPEVIVQRVYPTLDVAKVKACADFYAQERQRIDQYLAEGNRIGEAYYQEHLTKPNPLREKILARKAALEKNGES